MVWIKIDFVLSRLGQCKTVGLGAKGPAPDVWICIGSSHLSSWGLRMGACPLRRLWGSKPIKNVYCLVPFTIKYIQNIIHSSLSSASSSSLCSYIFLYEWTCYCNSCISQLRLLLCGRSALLAVPRFHQFYHCQEAATSQDPSWWLSWLCCRLTYASIHLGARLPVPVGR